MKVNARRPYLRVTLIVVLMFMLTTAAVQMPFVARASVSSYYLYFHVFDEATLAPIENATVEISFPNFTLATTDLTNAFGNVSFNLPAGNYSYDVNATGYLEVLSNEFLVDNDETFSVGVSTTIDLPIFITAPRCGENFDWENQTLQGNVTDTRILVVMYNVSSAIGDRYGFASIANGTFAANITLWEGYNVVTVAGFDEAGNAVSSDLVIAKLDTWRPTKSVETNLFYEFLYKGQKEWKENWEKTHDLHFENTNVKEGKAKGKLEDVNIDYTNETGKKSATCTSITSMMNMVQLRK